MVSEKLEKGLSKSIISNKARRQKITKKRERKQILWPRYTIYVKCPQLHNIA